MSINYYRYVKYSRCFHKKMRFTIFLPPSKLPTKIFGSMTRISARSLLQLGFFLLLVTICGGCRGLVSEVQRAQNKNAPMSLAVNGGTLEIDPTLFFSPAYTIDKKTGSDLEGLLVLKGPSQLLQRVDLYHFSLRPARPTYYVQNFSKNRDGQWEHAGVRGQPVDAQLSRQPEQITLKFRWHNGPIGDEGVAWWRERGIDVAVSFLLDGKEMRLAKQSVPIGAPAQ